MKATAQTKTWRVEKQRTRKEETPNSAGAQTSIKKKGGRYFKDDLEMANRYMEKMLDIINLQGNANQNPNEASSHAC